MKLMDLAGLMNMSATNSLLSMIAAVLFVSSQITLKSKIPRFACTSRRNGSTLRSYRFYDVFPTNISQVDLSYETVDTIEEFTVELQVLYFESIKGVGDNAGGESIS